MASFPFPFIFKSANATGFPPPDSAQGPWKSVQQASPSNSTPLTLSPSELSYPAPPLHPQGPDLGAALSNIPMAIEEDNRNLPSLSQVIEEPPPLPPHVLHSTSNGDDEWSSVHVPNNDDYNVSSNNNDMSKIPILPTQPQIRPGRKPLPKSRRHRATTRKFKKNNNQTYQINNPSSSMKRQQKLILQRRLSTTTSGGGSNRNTPPPSPSPTTTVTSTRMAPLSPESAERQARDAFLLRCREEGMSYKQIKARGNLPEAESTLRGRYRTLTKAKDERVRRPVWTDSDVSTSSLFGHSLSAAPFLPPVSLPSM